MDILKKTMSIFQSKMNCNLTKQKADVHIIPIFQFHRLPVSDNLRFLKCIRWTQPQQCTHGQKWSTVFPNCAGCWTSMSGKKTQENVKKSKIHEEMFKKMLWANNKINCAIWLWYMCTLHGRYISNSLWT